VYRNTKLKKIAQGPTKGCRVIYELIKQKRKGIIGKPRYGWKIVSHISSKEGSMV
jgi:hypothetical protein